MKGQNKYYKNNNNKNLQDTIKTNKDTTSRKKAPVQRKPFITTTHTTKGTHDQRDTEWSKSLRYIQ